MQYIWVILTEIIDPAETEAATDLEREILGAKVLAIENSATVNLAAAVSASLKCTMLSAASAASHAKYRLDQQETGKFFAAIVLKTKNTTVR